MRRLILTPWHQADPHALLAGRKAIAPNKRAARFLNAPFDSLETYARRRLRQCPLGVAKPLQTHAIMLEAVTQSLGTSDPAGTARTVAPVVRTLLRAGADLEALVSAGPPRVQRLARCAIAYRDALRAQKLLDPAEALRQACETSAEPEPILVFGYPRLGLDDRALIDAIAAEGSVVILPWEQHAQYQDNEATADFLESRGWTVERAEAPPIKQPLERLVPPAVQAVAHVYGHMEDEARGVLAQVKALLTDGVPADEIAVVARNDAEYGPTLLAVAHEFKLPLRALYAVPLSRTRFGSWLQHVLEAAEQRLPFETTFRLLEHPLSQPFKPEIRAKALQQHPAGQAWRDLNVDLAMLTWPDHATRGHWHKALRKLLKELGVRRQAAHWPQELLAIRALTESLPLLLEPENAVMSREDFAQTVLEALNLLTVPAQPGRGGVELHTPLSLYGARYRHVFVLGMAENVMPAPISDSPVLDFHDRKALAPLGVTLEDAAGAARREFLSFASLMQVATERLTLSYPRLAGRREGLPSAYLKGLGLAPAPLADRPAASLPEIRRHWVQQGVTRHEDPALPRVRGALEVERRRESEAAPDMHDGLVGTPFPLDKHVFSASQLTSLGQCAFKWFLSHGLKLAEVDEFEEDLSPATRGSLYHDTLDLAAKAAGNAPDLRAAMLGHLESAFAQAEAKHQLTQLAGWPYRREEHLRTLRQAVMGEDFLDPGATIVDTETRFDGIWHGLAVMGYIDRIDATPEGLVFIDYKTSGTKPPGAQDATGKTELDIQLPLYVQAAAPALYPGKPVQGARYYSLTKAKTLAEAQIDDEALEAFAVEVKRRLADGDYPVKPDRDGKACTYCDFELVCRKGPRLARKEIAP